MKNQFLGLHSDWRGTNPHLLFLNDTNFVYLSFDINQPLLLSLTLSENATNISEFLSFHRKLYTRWRITTYIKSNSCAAFSRDLSGIRKFIGKFAKMKSVQRIQSCRSFSVNNVLIEAGR